MYKYWLLGKSLVCVKLFTKFAWCTLREELISGNFHTHLCPALKQIFVNLNLIWFAITIRVFPLPLRESLAMFALIFYA